MKTYEDMREYLLNCGFKSIYIDDIDFNGDEVFIMDDFKFSIRQVKE